MFEKPPLDVKRKVPLSKKPYAADSGSLTCHSELCSLAREPELTVLFGLICVAPTSGIVSNLFHAHV